MRETVRTVTRPNRTTEFIIIALLLYLIALAVAIFGEPTTTSLQLMAGGVTSAVTRLVLAVQFSV